MTKLFLDTNVVIDFLCERGNYYLPAARLVTSAYRGEVGIFCSALTFATASYLMNRYKITNEDIFEKLKNFSTLCIRLWLMPRLWSERLIPPFKTWRMPCSISLH